MACKQRQLDNQIVQESRKEDLSRKDLEWFLNTFEPEDNPADESNYSGDESNDDNGSKDESDDESDSTLDDEPEEQQL